MTPRRTSIGAFCRRCGSRVLRAPRYDAGWPARTAIKKETTEKGDTHARTPLLSNLKLLLFIGPTKNYFKSYDVTTTFLHVELKEEAYARPPVAFFPNGGVLWTL